MKALVSFAAALAMIAIAPTVFGDILELKDGTVLLDCIVRDEGIQLLVWDSLDRVGTADHRIIPRSQVADRLSTSYRFVVDGEEKRFGTENPLIFRGAAWDVRPELPDLSVTYIEMDPKLAGLHGLVQYFDITNAPTPGGAPALDKRVKELEAEGKDRFLNPDYVVQDLKFKYEPGETITFTAHVKNLGFATSGPFDYRWLVDDQEVATGSHKKGIAEMGEATFEHKYTWQDGHHTIGFEIVTDQKEIATINNRATDAMWAFSYFYLVDKGRVESWHRNRTAYGTFSWEDFYRWHVDIMNLLFANSVYATAPQGVQARVRLDRIIYTDDVTPDVIRKALVAADGVSYHQGGWIWGNSDEENKTGVFADPDHRWRNQTEWSLPHELGHQLGLVDYYAIDYGGHEDHVWPDNGENIAHFQNHPNVMMHWHGPHLWSEVTAMYLNQTIDKPRGYFGDHYFAIPDECFLRIVDVNGKPLPNTRVEIFQRGMAVDQSKPAHDDQGVTWFEVVEDGNFGLPVSKDPVIIGQTNRDGVLRLPNRDAKEVVTFNGYHRKPNAWGNINVVGGRGLMLVKVVRDAQPAYFYIEAIDFNIACSTGHDKSYTVTLKTPYGSPDSPRPPADVRWEYTDRTKKSARVTWRAPGYRDQHPYERPIAYRVYRRIGPMALNDRPWYPVVTLSPDVADRGMLEFIVDLDKTHAKDVEWFSSTNRFAVSTIGPTGTESGLIQASDQNPKEQ
ncbi:MAG: hypothetical protein JW889_07305 [Verrucomicrobia bacterium]|nr:hypothetical protein [Verrucomicrobiota bacterium]